MSPSALAEVRTHLDKPTGPLDEFKAALITALSLQERSRELAEARQRQACGEGAAIAEGATATSADVEGGLPENVVVGVEADSMDELSAASAARTRHIAWYPSGSDETILASLRSLCNVMAEATHRVLTWTDEEVPLSLMSLADGLTEHVSTCRNTFLSLACGVRPAQRKKRYSLYIAYDPKDTAGRGVARFLQLALQRELRGLVVEELGDEVEGVHQARMQNPPGCVPPWLRLIASSLISRCGCVLDCVRVLDSMRVAYLSACGLLIACGSYSRSSER